MTARVDVRLRPGLPRVSGGAPWPPQDHGAESQPVAAPPAAVPSVTERPPVPAPTPSAGAAPAAPSVAHAAVDAVVTVPLRQGLPRVEGGSPWPPAVAVVPAVPTVPAASAATAADAAATSEPAATAAPAAHDGPRESLVARRSAWQGTAPVRPALADDGGRSQKPRWLIVAGLAGVTLLILAGMAVAFVRWFISLEAVREWMLVYPGHYALPDGAPVGVPAWVGWQHFLNAFLMILIIRSGLTVRMEQKPAVLWRRRGGKRAVSLTLWFHQSLDALWLLNGVVFVVVITLTGQWMRIVPTSWEVFPNAVSAGLQYLSMNWPLENGWVHYNSLQQLAYFTTVFIAAPAAVVTGFRMSGLWPQQAATLSRLYPVEWARRVHFPVMLYFVAFIAAHVILVFTTGALRNLNHMFAAKGSVDGQAYAGDWTGFWVFSLATLVVLAALAAARPLVLVPIARLFGTVSRS